MYRYVLSRLLLSIPTILGVATISFLLMRLIPGDPARVIAGVEGTVEDIERIRRQLGLDQPMIEQYLRFIGNLLVGDLGTSTRSGAPVTAASMPTSCRRSSRCSASRCRSTGSASFSSSSSR